MENGRLIAFCRLPGLLAFSARLSRSPGEAPSPLVVSEGRLVRDGCQRAQSRGIQTGISVIQARRLCPVLLVVPLETVNHQGQTNAFLDQLADLSPVVEPFGPDAAFADVTGLSPKDIAGCLAAWSAATLDLAPVVGFGISRVAARACGECGLLPQRLAEADVSFLWPEDSRVTARLKRLGLATFGQVAEMPESVLVYHFGRIGRPLHRRAHGIDFSPLAALYPPPRADAWLDLSEYPLADAGKLDAVLARVAERVAQQLRCLGRYGRRMVLRLSTERGEVRRERGLPVAIQEASDVLRFARALLRQTVLPAPVTAVRLLVEETEMPVAQTASLFPDKAKDTEATLRVTRRMLHARFGAKALQTLSQLPVSLRDERRTLVQEALAARR